MTIDFNGHMESQPYSITCSECGDNLHITKKEVDSDSDLRIEVEPCKCTTKEKK